MRHRFQKTATLAALAIATATAGLARVREPIPRPRGTLVATTSHFAFHSDFAVNLHDALLEAGRTRWSDKPELFHSGAEASCFSKLPRALRSSWDHAVGFYGETVSPPQARDRQFAIRLGLIGLGPEEEAERELVEIASSLRAAAAPAYRTCRWEAQDKQNRAWIEQLVPLVEAHGEEIAERLAELYEKPLDGLPIRVDIVQTVSWSSANTIYLSPEGGHIWIATWAGEGLVALETVFHEASHLLMGRGAPIPRALEAAAEKLGVPLPRDLWHGAQFHTTGEVVRRILDRAGKPRYTPMMFEQDIFGEFHEALKAEWTGYLDGDKTMEEAAEGLVRALAGGG